MPRWFTRLPAVARPSTSRAPRRVTCLVDRYTKPLPMIFTHCIIFIAFAQRRRGLKTRRGWKLKFSDRQLQISDRGDYGSSKFQF